MDAARNPGENDVSEDFVRELTDHQTAMLAFIRALMPGSSGARDLLQEINIILWQKRSAFQIGTSFKAWAFQVVRYHLMNHRRRLASKGWLVFDDALVERISPALEADPRTGTRRFTIASRSCGRRTASSSSTATPAVPRWRNTRSSSSAAPAH
jgi:RNA polymerase sigma-70 factor (ECF subfamily)